MTDEKKKPATPVPAATVLLIRDTDDGIEVFMVERSNRMHFASALVFPGGLVDPEDSEDRLLSRCDGIEGLRWKKRPFELPACVKPLKNAVLF